MNNNNLINIAKNLIQNDRVYGAAAVLSSVTCSSHIEYVQLSALCELCVQAFEKQRNVLAKLAIDKLEKSKDHLKSSLDVSIGKCDTELEVEVWRNLVAWVPVVTNSILDGYIAAIYQEHVTPSENQAYEVLINCAVITSLSNSTSANIEQLIALLPLPKLRELDDFFKKNSNDVLRALVLESLIKKVQTVNWEYYNYAQVLARQGKHQVALDNYKSFYEKAIADNEGNSIRVALLGALVSVVHVENLAEYYEYFLGKCPQKILDKPEVATIAMEVSEVIDSRRIFSECKMSFTDEIGYSYFDLATVKEMYSKAIELVEVHPSYKLFYRLFKICAVLNKADEAKFWLKQSTDANVLFFKVGV